MIERYSRHEMSRLWTERAKYERWLRVELAVCEALAERGEIPSSAYKSIRAKARFDPARIAELEKTARHDVIAFVSNVAESVGEEGRYLHWGVTSYDVVDTALSIALRDVCDLLLAGLDAVMEVLKEKARDHKNTVMVGRTHGVHAEPTTFGLKLALWYAEMGRNRERIVRARETVSVGKISGAVGAYGQLDPTVEEFVCRSLGLRPAPLSSQILQRDRHAEYVSALAILGGTIEKIAVELRHLQRTEVLELEEYFAPGQKGSSAMPHKRNPISAENLSGLARMLRGYAASAFENQALWHERDISHSSVERIVLPDASILADYMLSRLRTLLSKLITYPENMKQNLQLTRGLIFSEKVLLALVKKGLSREEAYGHVQRVAHRVWERGGDFKKELLQDAAVREHLSEEEIARCFDLKEHLRNVGKAFKRVFGR